MMQRIRELYKKIPYKKTIGISLVCIEIIVGGYFYGKHQKEAGIQQGRIEGINMLTDAYQVTSEYYNSTVENWKINPGALTSAWAMAEVVGYDGDQKEKEFRDYANTSRIVADELQKLTHSQIEELTK